MFKGYGGNSLNVVGTFEAEVQSDSFEVISKFYGVDEVGKSLLGLETSKMLDILKIQAAEMVEHVERLTPFNKMHGVVLNIPIDVEVYRLQPVVNCGFILLS